MNGPAERPREARGAAPATGGRERAPGGLEAIRERVLEGARLGPGDDVLALDAGAGLLALAARERIGDGWVYAVDPDVGVLDELRRAAHEAGAAGIAYLLGDPRVLPLPDGSVDVALGRSALRDVADLAEVARELHRVLRPGGRVSLCGPVDRRGTDLAIADLATAAEREANAAATPLARLDERELAAALRGAGFVEVEVELGESEETWAVDARRTVAWVTARKP